MIDKKLGTKIAYVTWSRHTLLIQVRLRQLSFLPYPVLFHCGACNMNLIKMSFGMLTGVVLTGTGAMAQELKSAFTEGTVGGNIRAHYNTRDYDTREDEGAFALGGALRAESGSIGAIKVGAGFYTAQDFGTNSQDPSKVNGRLGSDLEVLAEAYLLVEGAGTTLTVGRQKINTPFANPGDAFIIPFTFQGYSVINRSLENFVFELDYLNEIKNRNSEEFVDVGLWTSARYGIGEAENTAGTINFGTAYANDPVKVELWLTRFSDFFDNIYMRGDYAFPLSGSIKPFAAVQVAQQSESGDALLGKVDSTLYGVLAGVGFGKAKFTLAHNTVSEQENAFRNGAFLAPYNYSTSPLFTNNMLQTVEDVDAGVAHKFTFNYAAMDSLALQLSYATFDFEQAADRDAAGLDAIYSFGQYLQGLSLRWRVEVVTSDVAAVEVTNHRLQAQWAF